MSVEQYFIMGIFFWNALEDWNVTYMFKVEFTIAYILKVIYISKNLKIFE